MRCRHRGEKQFNTTLLRRTIIFSQVRGFVQEQKNPLLHQPGMGPPAFHRAGLRSCAHRYCPLPTGRQPFRSHSRAAPPTAAAAPLRLTAAAARAASVFFKAASITEPRQEFLPYPCVGFRGRLVDGAEDGAAGHGELIEDVDHDVGGVGVEAARGLFEEENGRFHDELYPDARLPLQPAVFSSLNHSQTKPETKHRRELIL
jgi:hypothetical protein